MKTIGIEMHEEPAERDRTETAWSFWLNGQEFGGYAYNESDAFSDAERILELQIDELPEAGIDAAYESLVGYKPIASEGMSLEDAAQLLFERMKEGE